MDFYNSLLYLTNQNFIYNRLSVYVGKFAKQQHVHLDIVCEFLRLSYILLVFM